MDISAVSAPELPSYVFINYKFMNVGSDHKKRLLAMYHCNLKFISSIKIAFIWIIIIVWFMLVNTS